MKVKDSLRQARARAKGGLRKTAMSTAVSAASGASGLRAPLFRADITLDALIENVQTLTGQRGDGAAVIMVTDNAGKAVPFYPDGSGGSTDGSGGSGGGDSDDGGQQPAYPTAPTGLAVNGGFSVVELDWDTPKYYGHSLTQIWRCPEDNLSLAVNIGSTAANIYSDPIDPVFEGYYWIRFVNADAVPGPYNDSVGTYVKTQESTEDIINVINETINDSPLIEELQADIDGVEEQVTTIDNEGSQAFQNMWSVKASADGITAGIGLVAGVDADGIPISQVAVAATQFFVFDPNNPNPDGSMEALFYVDAEYGVCMEKAVIEQATIQVLNAQTIVADEVVAGIEIEAPVIKGGEIEIGSDFAVTSDGNMTANNATLNDVTLNRVTANEGQFDNVTIGENCLIEGTLSANQIKGDIVNAVGFSMPSSNGYVEGTRTVTILDDQEFDRTVIIPAILFTAYGWTSMANDHKVDGGSSLIISIYWNDTLISARTASQYKEGSDAQNLSLVKDMLSGQGNVSIKITASSDASNDYTPNTECSDICLMVAKKGSGGIIIS